MARNVRYTLTARNGGIIAASPDRRVVEDRLARLIEDDGMPTGSDYGPSYLVHMRWDSPAGTPLARVVLGCDNHGWWQPDGSGVPETAAPARRIDRRS